MRQLFVRQFSAKAVVLCAILIAPRLSFAQVCPAAGRDTGCGTIITIRDNGVSVASTGQGPYDGGDDTLVGVVNNSSRPVFALGLQSALPIFGFDGDGIDTYGIPGNGSDTTGYGGPNAYFTNIDPSRTSGVVNFIVPIAALGGTGYFSLENALASAVSCSQLVNNSVPKPASGGTTVTTTFTPQVSGYTLQRAAAACGFSSFNWQQTVTHLPDPNPFTAYNFGSPMKLTGASVPFNDPPPGGGYSYQSTLDFSYPFYCSGSDFSAGGVCAQTSTTLQFLDRPADPCIPNADGTPSAAFKANLNNVATLCGNRTSPLWDSYVGFTTHLMGVLPSFVPGTNCVVLGTCIDLGIGFTWTDDFNGTSGGAFVTKNGTPIDPGSGTGGSTITSISEVTTYQYQGLGVTTVNGNPTGIVTVALGTCAPLPLSLNIGPSGDLVTLSTSNASIVTLSNNLSVLSVFVPATGNLAQRPPMVCGVGLGSASITESDASTSVTQNVQTTANLSFDPASITLASNRQGRLTLTLSGPAPAGGLTVNLKSDNTAVATVPASVVVPANTTSVVVPVVAIGSGTTLIHASALPNVPDTTTTVIVP
jgi:hypothetical protein